MRKLFVLFVVSVLLSACKDNEEKPYGDNVPFGGEIEETIYNGHEYIIFKEGHSYGTGGGLGLAAIHNPDCPCMKKGE